MDEAFDRQQKLHSLPSRLGTESALRISGMLHAAAFAALLVLYLRYLRTGMALATLAAIGALLYLEHRKAQDVEVAFFKINAVLSFGVLGFVAAGVMTGL